MSPALWFLILMTPLETPSSPPRFPLTVSPLSLILGEDRAARMTSPRSSSKMRVERPGREPRYPAQASARVRRRAAQVTRLPKSEGQGLPIQLARLCTALGRPHRRSANHILDIIDVYIYSISLDCSKVSILIKIRVLETFPTERSNVSWQRGPLFYAAQTY